MFFGVAKYDGNQLILNRGDDQPPFVVFDDWISRIKPVTEDAKAVFEDAEYYLPLSIGSLPEGVNPSESGYLETGLVWPSAEKI